LSRPVQIAVIGAGRDADPELLTDAEEIGRRLAEAGAVVVCGGLGGVMEAVSRGARQAGGTTIGIVPTTDPADASDEVTHAVATGIGEARNLAVVASGQAVIAIGGEWGTLAEIGFARKLGRPVVALRSWPLRDRSDTDLGITEVHTPVEAVRAALSSAAVGEPSRAKGDASDEALD
jgi:uncharacterized protein (TIGR00725 family)